MEAGGALFFAGMLAWVGACVSVSVCVCVCVTPLSFSDCKYAREKDTCPKIWGNDRVTRECLVSRRARARERERELLAQLFRHIVKNGVSFVPSTSSSLSHDLPRPKIGRCLNVSFVPIHLEATTPQPRERGKSLMTVTDG